MSDIKDMLKSVVDGDPSSFKDYFSAAISDRIQSNLDMHQQEVSSTMMQSDSEEEIQEGKKVVNFKDPKAAKKAADALQPVMKSAGVKMTLSGKKITIADDRDKDLMNMVDLVVKDFSYKNIINTLTTPNGEDQWNILS